MAPAGALKENAPDGSMVPESGADPQTPGASAGACASTRLRPGSQARALAGTASAPQTQIAASSAARTA
jgi:hypothetical protein